MSFIIHERSSKRLLRAERMCAVGGSDRGGPHEDCSNHGASKTATLALAGRMGHIGACAAPRRPFVANDRSPEPEWDVVVRAADGEAKASAVTSLATTLEPLKAALQDLVAATW